MSNPFAQDPFGEILSPSTAAQPQQPEFRPTRRPPPKPGGGGAPAVHNPFSQPAAASAVDEDPFGLLAASAPAPAATTSSSSPAQQQHQQPAPQTQQQWDDDVFGLFSSAPAAGAGGSSQPTNLAAAAGATTPAVFALPPPQPPAYEDAAALPPPPSYEQSADLPPPSYEEVMGSSSSSHNSHNTSTAQQQPAALRPARAAPPAPPAAAASTASPAAAVAAGLGVGVVGPLTAARPSRPAPKAPPAAGHISSTSTSSSTTSSLMPARPAPRAPPSAADAAAAGLSALDISGSQPPAAAVSGPAGGSRSSSSSSRCVVATTGNVGAAPSGSAFGGQQVHQQELGAILRLPPLNPKATAPLKHLAAGLGCLFAGPVQDDGVLLLQYCPTASGSTLPLGGTPARSEDHDSAAAAALGGGGSSSSSSSASYASAGSSNPYSSFASSSFSASSGAGSFTAGSAGGGSKQGRVSCLLFGGVPGRLWAGCSDGRVHCWSVGGDGSVARLLHSWEAHSGKVKGLALSPCGRLFTGSASGAIKMWSYGNPAFTDSAPPRPLRQLKKVDARSGVAGTPHSKVVGLAVSAGGRVLWSVGKATVSLWSTHNGEHLGSLSESCVDAPLTNSISNNPLAAGLAGYSSAPQPLPQNPVGGDINPKQGLDAAVLDALFERPSAELLAEEDAFDSERDAASVAYNAAVKGAAKAGKLFNKLTKMAAAKINESKGADSGGDSEHGARGYPSPGSAGASGVNGGMPVGGQQYYGASSAQQSDAYGLEAKVERWGSIKKLAAAADGSVWVCYKRGLLEKYAEGGKLLWSSSSSGGGGDAGSVGGGGGGGGGGAVFKPAGGISSLAAVGSSVWVGDQQGRVWVLDAGSCRVQRSWRAHTFPVCSIAGGGAGGAAAGGAAGGGPLVYTLGKAGGIRAWPASLPPVELTAAWRAETQECLQQQSLQVLAATWNVNETKPSRHGLEMWLGERAQHAQLVMIGLQEVEMGTGSVALDVVYQQLAKSKLEAGTQAVQAWSAAISEVLCTKGRWKRVALRQMSGILALVFARAELEPHIGEVATASVACGVMGYGGNKGAAAISFSLFRRRVVLVSSHFAAHQEKVEARNADYAKIVKHLHFHNVHTADSDSSSVGGGGGDRDNSSSSYNSSSPARNSSSPSRIEQQQQQQRYGGGSDGVNNNSSSSNNNTNVVGEEDWGAGMKDAELLVWVGDFNYRVDAGVEGFVPADSRGLNPERPVNEQLYRFVLQKIAARQHTDLLTGDQCSREMARGTIFHGLAEGPIRFLPTYKFEKGRESSALQPYYDQGEKMRVPAWTDRVLFRGGGGGQKAALEPNAAQSAADVRVSLSSPDAYNAVLEVNDSDHKPVYAALSLLLPWYQQQQLRSVSLARLWQAAQLCSSSSRGAGVGAGLAAAGGGAAVGGGGGGGEFGGGAVRLLLEPQQQQLVLPSSHVPRHLTVTNPLQDSVVCFAVCSGAGGCVPAWLEVTPAVGVLQPGQSLNLRVQGSRGGGWGSRAGAAAGGGGGGMGVGAGYSCELRVVGCVEGSVESGVWPLGLAGSAAALTVVLQ